MHKIKAILLRTYYEIDHFKEYKDFFCFQLKLSFNQTVSLCEENQMNVLSNQNEKGYEKIIQMENFNRVGRKIAWIGAQMKKRSKWYWIDYKTPEW